MGIFRSQSPRALFVIPGLFYLFWWLVISNWRIRHFYWCPFPGCILFLLYFQSFFAPVHTFLFTFHPDICKQKPVNRAKNILKVIRNWACEKKRVFSCVLLLMDVIVVILHKKGYSSPYPIKILLWNPMRQLQLFSVSCDIYKDCVR